jgi:hypothetical protein
VSRIAYIGVDRHVHVVAHDGTGSVQLSSEVGHVTGGWGVARPTQDAWAWPVWSPDGTWIAAFSVQPGDQASGPARVRALALDGVRETEWAELPGMSPIYMQWHPGGGALTMLLQHNEELVLAVVRRERLGQLRIVEQGVPLFFNWVPDGSRLLVHAGSRQPGEGRIVLRDPLGGAEDVLYDLPPGSFCAPVFTADLAGYVVRHPGDPLSEVVVSRADGTGRRSLLTRRGLLALLAAPRGLPFLAVSNAPRGEGTPYKGIDRIDLDTGEVTRLTDEDLLAFFWSPDGEWLLTAQVDADNNCLRWHRIDANTGASTFLGTFWPTRDLLFFLHFFEQYGGSHALLSSDARFLVYAGYPAGGGQADLSAPPRIYVRDTSDPERPPWEVGSGSFGVFSPVD